MTDGGGGRRGIGVIELCWLVCLGNVLTPDHTFNTVCWYIALWSLGNWSKNDNRHWRGKRILGDVLQFALI